jgi:hypothetical protein
MTPASDLGGDGIDALVQVVQEWRATQAMIAWWCSGPSLAGRERMAEIKLALRRKLAERAMSGGGVQLP